MNETGKQFSFTRAASSTSGRAKNQIPIISFQLSTINYMEPNHFTHLIQQFQFGVGDDQVRADAVSALPTV
jgi:hypothetical protein